MNETVLIIEDDKTIQKFLNISLKTKGYNIIGVETGMEGLSAFMMEKPNIILLDLGLPDTDGIEILQDIRRQSDIPIIIISARDQEKEKILALDAGADDYVVKPFGPGELMARIRVALRNKNSSSQAESVFELDYLKVDFDKRKVFIRDREIHLTPLEYKITVNMEALKEEEPETQENTAEDTEKTKEVSENTDSEPAEETANEETVLTEENAEANLGNVNTNNVNAVSKGKIPRNDNTNSFIVLGLFAVAILVILLLKLIWDRAGIAGRGIQRGFKIIRKKVAKNTYQPVQTTDDGFNLSQLEETEISDEEIEMVDLSGVDEEMN